jgi:Uma2 family endonuclease
VGALPESGYMSPAEYLQWEHSRGDDEKYEYVDGRVFAMAGASRAHNRISMKLTNLLFNHLEGDPCEVYQSDMKVGIRSLDTNRYYYPDVQVSCEEETDPYYNTSPCLIVEVLSDSTAYKDRTEKLAAYRLFASLQEYVLCSQDTPHIEVYRRARNWEREIYTAGQVLLLASVGLEVVVDDIYRFLM